MAALDPAEFACPVCRKKIPIGIAIDMNELDTKAGKVTAHLIADITDLQAHIESEHQE